MHTVERRVYDTDDEGRRHLLYRPGDVVTEKEARRVASLVEPNDETPALPLDRMTVKELRAVCDAEGIDPAGANTRANFREVIEVGRAAAGAQTSER